MRGATGTPMTFDHGMSDRGIDDQYVGNGHVNRGDELDWLMSLALDDALDASEALRLEELLQETPENFERWTQWQTVDNDFSAMPAVLPPVDFAEKFSRRLEIQERRRRLRTGIVFGLAALALWGSALAGVGILAALMWTNQAEWTAAVIPNLTYWWAGVVQFGRVQVNTLETLWTAPQTRALMACYLVAAVAILAGWFVLLRRSTRELPLAETQMVEA